ncbi:MAG: CoA ester lyase [Bacteroidetes bacterium]|nr:CoA ester lyase [Bacteroidota bacterium]|tara:strand:- start:583 stop:1416 length:834 start_codon:yes stop_codon:yes gene_type:complete
MFLSRCILFTPANRPERFAKGKQTGADGIVIDLEDAISLAGKDEARDIAINYFKGYQKDPDFVQCLRINSMKTPAGLKDVSALIDNNVRPDILVIPKTESPAELTMLAGLLPSEDMQYIALIETAKGLRYAEDIALANKKVCGLVFGGADLAADLGATMEWEPLFAARSHIVRAAAAAGIAAIDVPYLHLKDPDDSGVLEETRRVKALGFTSKFAIHPKHIKPILESFAPTSAEIERATRVVEAYDQAHGDACEIDGKMIDVPVYRSANRVLAIANK